MTHGSLNTGYYHNKATGSKPAVFTVDDYLSGLDQSSHEGICIECEADCQSDLDAHERMCGWNFGIMDEFQDFIEQRVSTAMFDKLQTNHLLKERGEGQESIKSLIRDCVDSAFKEYKKPVDHQHERVTELHEEPEEISEPPDESKPHLTSGIELEGVNAAELTTLPIPSLSSTLSPSDSIVSTATSSFSEGSTISDWYPFDGGSLIPNTSYHMEFFGSEEGNLLQEPLLLPPVANLQSCDCQLWALGPGLFGCEPPNESFETIDGDLMDHGFKAL